MGFDVKSMSDWCLMVFYQCQTVRCLLSSPAQRNIGQCWCWCWCWWHQLVPDCCGGNITMSHAVTPELIEWLLADPKVEILYIAASLHLTVCDRRSVSAGGDWPAGWASVATLATSSPRRRVTPPVCGCSSGCGAPPGRRATPSRDSRGSWPPR